MVVRGGFGYFGRIAACVTSPRGLSPRGLFLASLGGRSLRIHLQCEYLKSISKLKSYYWW
jgi:hypothetical protein